MLLLIVSFVAGIITVLSPCVLTLLPIIVGGTIGRGNNDEDGQSFWRPIRVAAGLVVSVVLFTLLLKASTSLLGVPTSVWSVLAGGTIVILGINMLFPDIWKRLPGVSKLNMAANQSLGGTLKKNGAAGDVLTGAALGPVFNSCSPTYALLVATVLPASFLQGLGYLTAYAVGLGGMLLVIGFLGQAAVQRFRSISNPHGWFMRGIAILFIATGISIATGLDRQLQAKLLDSGTFDFIIRLEERLE